jgi:hypothetical protein
MPDAVGTARATGGVHGRNLSWQTNLRDTMTLQEGRDRVARNRVEAGCPALSVSLGSVNVG